MSNSFLQGFFFHPLQMLHKIKKLCNWIRTKVEQGNKVKDGLLCSFSYTNAKMEQKQYRVMNLWTLDKVKYAIAHLPVTLAKKPSLLVDSLALSFTNAALLRINLFFFHQMVELNRSFIVFGLYTKFKFNQTHTSSNTLTSIHHRYNFLPISNFYYFPLGVVHILRNHFLGPRETHPPYVIL